MFTIGKLAALATVSNDTLRYYEQEGLISPPQRARPATDCMTRILSDAFVSSSTPRAAASHLPKSANCSSYGGAIRLAAATFARGRSRRSCRSKTKFGR